MCGRFTLRSSQNQLVLAFALESVPHLVPRYNIAPSQAIATVRAIAGGKRELAIMQWGLVPSWSKDPKSGSQLINARAETLAEKPSFRTLFKRRRCLIPADGFYEWRKIGDKKQPYFIRLRDDRVFAFAGLWDQWRPAEGPPLETCTIVTTIANDLTRPLHDRMPVILSPADYDVWLDPANQETEKLEPLLQPYPPDEMRFDAVSTLVNNARNEKPECVVVQAELF